MQTGSLINEILKLKREYGAMILVHNYQSPEIQDMVPREIIEKVKRAIENTFRVLGREPLWSRR